MSLMFKNYREKNITYEKLKINENTRKINHI